MSDFVLRFADSFDHYDAARVSAKWDAFDGASHTPLLAPGRTGNAFGMAVLDGLPGYAVKVMRSQDGGSRLTSSGSGFLISDATWNFGFSFKSNGLVGNGTWFSIKSYMTVSPENPFGIDKELFNIGIDFDNTIIMTMYESPQLAPGRSVWRSGFAIHKNVWYHLQIAYTFFTIGKATTITAACLLNGDELALPIAAGGIFRGDPDADPPVPGDPTSPTVNAIELGGAGVIYDDFYALSRVENFGTWQFPLNANDARIPNGDARVQMLLPISGGDVQQWAPKITGSPQVDMIKENPPDDDVSYIVSSGFNQISAFRYGSLPLGSGGPGAILGVQLTPDMTADNPDYVTCVAGLNSGQLFAADVDPPATLAFAQVFPLAYLMFPFQFVQNPLTATGWLYSDIPAFEFGVVHF